MSLAAYAGETNECVSILINPFNACCSRNQFFAIYKMVFSLIILERMKPLSLTRSIHLSYEVGVTVY